MPEAKAHTIGFVDWLVVRCFRSYHKSICRFVLATLDQAVVEIVLVVRVSLAAMGAMYGLSWSTPKPIDPVWSS